MSSATDARALLERLDRTGVQKGEIRTIAKEQGKNHALAVQLWKSGGVNARMLSFLLLDLKAVDVPYLEMLVADVEGAGEADQSQLLDWMVANVIVKKASLKNETARWRTERSTIRQRVFWSVQARSVRAENHEHNERLLEHVERDLASASGPVQWNMNWTAAQIGIADERLRSRCVALGEKTGLYRDYPVSKGCTSPYLPLWIGSVVGKQRSA